ncbi:acyl-CoA N-acyltransferase [Hypoxylon cercidicola]|nr:acyl-CoA N-acyltransferase [Hypoxylon cercidicola]
MATLKRKRYAEHESAPQPRRATRQHPAAPEEHQLRSGRIRAHAIEKPTIALVESIEKRPKKGDASKTKIERNPATNTNATASSKTLKENILSQNDGKKEQINTSISSLGANTVPKSTTLVRRAAVSPPPQTRLVPLNHTPTLQQQTLRPTHTAPTEKTSTPKRPASSPNKPPVPPGTPRADRNIDKVVLGNICFKAWYPSYYGKEVLGDASGNNGAKDKNGGGGKMGRIGGGKRAGLPPPMLDRLYVCPCCFKYSKELVMWWEHVRCCERSFEMPGTKVYTHPKGSRTVRRLVPGAAKTEGSEKGKGRGRKKSDAGAVVAAETAVDEVVKDEGEWSVWEVDGEKDRLFCQNLSLFAKLFLDNKSVFFDVTGFNYFLLVYTPKPSNAQPPPSLTSNLPQPPAPKTHTEPPHQPPTTSLAGEAWSRPQVVGFFSKEKLSWDNNNLACILVFPPWQRKGLGALLMGVSYEISRREDILGGPEKPISELGRKGYKRFWAGEIARWLLGLGVPNPNSEAADGEDGETLASIEQCSKATWIAPEDCLAVLREMGVVEDAGPGPAEHPGAAASVGERAGSAAEAEAEGEVGEVPMVPRVRVDKTAVRRWVETHKIDLTRACDPDGFVEGYAVKGSEGEEMDEA